MAEGFTCPKCGRTSYNRLDIANRYCGACHIYIDQWLRIRLVIDGQVASETWFHALAADEFGAQLQATIDATKTLEAIEAGKEWRLEVYDPETDRSMRLGSSKDGMVAPVEVELADHDETLRRMAQVLGWLPE